MKKFNFKSVLLIAVAMSLSVFTYGQQGHDHSKMKMNHKKGGMMKNHSMMSVMLKDKNLNKAYMHYIMINKALVKADAKKVQMMSGMLVTILNSYGKASDASAIAAKLAADSDIDGQRKLFAQLTLAFEPLLKGQVSKGTIYKNFCPMANGGGAYWFSNSENIINPYLGSAMPSCGEVKETIKVE
jgi:Protein of unknown function (DUF3347)